MSRSLPLPARILPFYIEAFMEFSFAQSSDSLNYMSLSGLWPWNSSKCEHIVRNIHFRYREGDKSPLLRSSSWVYLWSHPLHDLVQQYPCSISVCWNPNVMVSGGWDLGRCLGHEGEPSWMRFVLLYKRPQRSSSPLPPHEDTMRSWQSTSRKRVHRNPTKLVPWSCTSSLQNCGQ